MLIMIPGVAVAGASIFTILPTAIGRIWPSFLSTAVGFLAFVTSILWLAPTHEAAGGAWARTINFLVATAVILPFVVPILRQAHPVTGEDQTPTNA